MQKIDRLGWAAGIAFRSYGLKIGVRVNDPAVMERVLTCLPPGWRRQRSPNVNVVFSLRIGPPSRRANVRNYSLLYTGIHQVGRTMDLEELFELLENELQLRVAEYARRRVFVHAGVVGWQGQAILVPGRSFSGKSTLVQALLRAGATYYSDEYAVLDSAGRVYPYPRRLSIRQGAGQPTARPWAAELGAATGAKPLPVALVVLSRFQQGATWRPRTLSEGQGVVELMNHTLCARSQPENALAALRRLVKRAKVLKGMRGEADEVARQILNRVAHRPKSWWACFSKLFSEGVLSCFRKLDARS